VPAERFDFVNAQGQRLAALLDTPAGEPKAYALFAHCFTCGKDVTAARRIAQALTALGIGVLRFDFTGLGASEGEFANTTFSSNVADLLAAAGALRKVRRAPAILIGHSLGGAAVLAAAADVPRALAHQPSAIEGLGSELADVWAARRKRPLPSSLPAGGGWLFIETTPDQAAAVVADLEGPHATRVVVTEAEQRELWRIREDGAGLATRTAEGAEAWPGFEDAAVPPERLADYLRGFEALMLSAGRKGTVFGHFGEGCLHVRIDHDLQTVSGRQQFAEFTAPATELVVTHGGSVSGEHGDGQHQAQNGLADDESLHRVDAERDDDDGRRHGRRPADPERYAPADESLHNDVAGHCPDHRAGQTGGEQ